MEFQYAQSLIEEIEKTLEGATVEDHGNSLVVVSIGRTLAITPKTDDIAGDVDRLRGFLSHLIANGGKFLTPPNQVGW